jgi:hypothetical protein
MRRATFMAGSVQGTKTEIKKANRVANVIVTLVILSFIVAMLTVLSAATAKAQGRAETLINMMDEIEKPFQTVLDNLKIDPDVNTIEHGVNKYGRFYIKATYFDSGNTVRHVFSKKNACTSVEFRSTNFRNYDLFMQALADTFVGSTYDKIRNDKEVFMVDMKMTKASWFIKIGRK